MSETKERSAPALVGDLVHHVTELFRKEVQLLRAELGEKADQVFAALGFIVAAVVVALTALNVLAAAIVAGLTNAGIAAGWAALIVGVAFAAAAGACRRGGTRQAAGALLLEGFRTTPSLHLEFAFRPFARQISYFGLVGSWATTFYDLRATNS